MEEKNRPLTLIATIVSIVFSIVAIGFYGFYLYLFTGWLGFTIVSAIFLMDILFVTTILVLSAVLIGKWNASVEAYNKKIGVSVTLIVFMCFVVLLDIIDVCIGNYYSIVTALTYAMCGVFIMIDVCRNKKAAKVFQQSAKTEDTKISEETSVQGGIKADAEIEHLRKQLAEAKAMKEQGIISEEEYEKLKAKVLDKAEL